MNDVREAAERLRQRGSSNKSVYDHDDFRLTDLGRSQLQYDEEALADAYLAEHPADDDETVKWLWLRERGFAGDDCDLWLGGLNVRLVGGNMEWFADDLPLKNQDTRGDVRRLCRALGIELKEPSDE